MNDNTFQLVKDLAEHMKAHGIDAAMDRAATRWGYNEAQAGPLRQHLRAELLRITDYLHPNDLAEISKLDQV